MNPISKTYMRLQFQKRVDALKKAGIPVTQQTVYDESIEVGVPVPSADADKQYSRRQSDYRVNRLAFVVEFVISSVAAFFRFLVTPRGPTVFEDANRQFFQSGGVTKRLVRALVMVLIGLAGTIWSGKVVFQGVASSSWPVVTGVIQSAQLQVNQPIRKQDFSTKIAAVQYTYSVGGQTYTSDRVSFGDYGSSGAGRADKLLRRYPSGASASVHYNPQRPEESVLETGSTWFMNLWFGLVCFLAFCGFIGIVRAINGYRIYGNTCPTEHANVDMPPRR